MTDEPTLLDSSDWLRIFSCFLLNLLWELEVGTRERVKYHFVTGVCILEMAITICPSREARGASFGATMCSFAGVERAAWGVKYSSIYSLSSIYGRGGEGVTRAGTKEFLVGGGLVGLLHHRIRHGKKKSRKNTQQTTEDGGEGGRPASTVREQARVGIMKAIRVPHADRHEL